jgi:serine O-acetyltransferase
MEINNLQELKECLKKDASNYQSQQSFKKYWYNMFSNPICDQKYIWKYIKCLRYVEYYLRKKELIYKLTTTIYLHRLRRLSYITGFQIPPFTCGKGLTIWHWGPIIINPSVRIGDNCTLYPGVLIGHKYEGALAPHIGNNVFIGSGAKIIGDITIGNNVTIAPNTNVTKDIVDNCICVGNPTKIIEKNELQ